MRALLTMGTDPQPTDPLDAAIEQPEERLKAQRQEVWRLQQAEILARYPAIGIPHSAANVAFVRMFRHLQGSVDAVALADLVMIYPPK